jgi:hypothetical protein
MKSKLLLLIFFGCLVCHSCKKGDETDILTPIPPTQSAQPYYVMVNNSDADDNLGIIVADTNKTEIDLFYGKKDFAGKLFSIERVVTGLIRDGIWVVADLDENVLPQSITCSKNDSIITISFTNYNLSAGTVDLQIADGDAKVLFSKEKVKCEQALVKFNETKKLMEQIRNLRTSKTGGGDPIYCNLYTNAVISLADGIGCLAGITGLVVSLPTLLAGPLGWISFGVQGYFTYDSCKDFIADLDDNTCETISLKDKLLTDKDCWDAVKSFFTKKRDFPVNAVSCVSGMISAITKILNEKVNAIPDPVNNEVSYTVTSVSTGDPHLTGFDRNRYSFMAAGEFIAAKSVTDNFEVQVRQEEIKSISDNGTVSWNTGLAIRTGNGIICIYPSGVVYVNGVDIGSFESQDLQGGGRIEKNDSYVTITNSKNDVIKVKLFELSLDYYITPSVARKGKLTGLLGNYDGSDANDLQLQTGGIVQNKFDELYPKFSDSWRIKQSESLFVYDAGTSTQTYTDRNFPRKPISFTASQRTNAKSVCEAAGITDPVLLENCIIDVASTNDNNLADRIYESQIAYQALDHFAIGGFSSSDVQLAYNGATAENKQAILDTKDDDFARIMMKQGVNIRNGFVTEFSFSTSELNVSSTFYLALWPTDDKKRNSSQYRAGFGFSQNGGKYFLSYIIDNGNGSVHESEIPNFVDGNIHNVKIVEKKQPSGVWKIDISFDNVVKLSADNNDPISRQIGANNDIGFIEFQINRGKPSKVNLFNWSFGAN